MKELFRPFGEGTRAFQDEMEFISAYVKCMTQGTYATANERFATYCGTKPEKVATLIQRFRQQMNGILAQRRKQEKREQPTKKYAPRKRKK